MRAGAYFMLKIKFPFNERKRKKQPCRRKDVIMLSAPQLHSNERNARQLLQLLTPVIKSRLRHIMYVLRARITKGWKVNGVNGHCAGVNSHHGSVTRSYVNIAVENV